MEASATMTGKLDEIRKRVDSFYRMSGNNLLELQEGDSFRIIEDMRVQAPSDILYLLGYIDWLNIEHASSIARERSDERQQTILDMRKYLADGLRKIGIEADDKISLTEVLAIIEGLVSNEPR